jgi:CRISPR/Cas system-associated exonuclease Cas4 (RecB family)
MLALLGTACVAVLAVLVAGAIARLERHRRYRDEKAAMPAELAGAALVMSEQRIAWHGRYPSITRTDQVFLNGEGELVVMETKTRRKARWHPSDVIQLSVTARILTLIQKRPVARHGYLRIKRPDKPPVYRRLALLTPRSLARLQERYWALTDGIEKPAPARHPAFCRQCLQRDRCPHPRINES